jgi:hypothetical protein
MYIDFTIFRIIQGYRIGCSGVGSDLWVEVPRMTDDDVLARGRDWTNLTPVRLVILV